jgi:hypothetical protein
LTLSARIPPTRARSIAPIFPPTFSPLEAVKSSEVASLPLETVSETVSEGGKRVVKNCDELEQILLETTIESAIIE